MKSIDLSRSFFGCIRISRTGLGVFFAALLVGSANAGAQNPEDPQRSAPTTAAPEMPGAHGSANFFARSIAKL
jgi:hypothetical protein